jgi:DNA-binding beta-propeller fold protein YncE
MKEKIELIHVNTLRKLLFAVCVCVCSLGFVSCGDKDSEGDTVYDPGKPVKVTSFYPDSGRIAEKIFLHGENFGSDPDKIKVYFNQKRAAVIGSNGTEMYVLCPRTPGDTCTISVIVGKDSLVYTQKFRYKISISVSTIAGNGTGSYIPGTLSSSTIMPNGLCVDDDNNVFVGINTGPKGLARINEDEDILESLYRTDAAAMNCIMPAIDRRTGIIYSSNDAVANTFYTFNPKEGWAPRTRVWTYKEGTNPARPANTWKKSIGFSALENMLYLHHYNGHLLKIDPETLEAEVVLVTPQGDDYGMAFHPLKPNLLYMCFGTNAGTLANSIAVIDINQNPLTIKRLNYDAPTVAGHKDGDLAEARFNFPFQLFFDPEGNCYIADYGNHCIRKITTDDKVETVVGIPGVAGFKDGGKEDALFNMPAGITVSQDGTIYVGDRGNNRVRKLAIE